MQQNSSNSPPTASLSEFSWRTKLALLVFKLGRGFFRRIPFSIAKRLLAALAIVVSHFCPRERRIALAQLRFAFPDGDPRKPLAKSNDRTEVEKSLNSLLDDVFRHFGISIAEIFSIGSLLEQQAVAQPNAEQTRLAFKHLSSSGMELVEDIIKQKQGAIALSGHVGSIELLAAYYVRFGVRLCVIGRRPNYPWLAEAIQELRSAYGVKTFWRDDPTAPRRIVRALKSGKVVAALIDQDTKLDNDFAPFFGLDAASPNALIRIAVQYQIPVITSFICRTDSGKHTIHTSKIDYDPEDPDAIKNILLKFNPLLEDLIRQYPEQWPWWHRRWRRRPGVDYSKEPDKLPSTESYLKWISNMENQAQT